MHITLLRTVLSNYAGKDIKELDALVALFCNEFAENKRKDNFVPGTRNSI